MRPENLSEDQKAFISNSPDSTAAELAEKFKVPRKWIISYRKSIGFEIGIGIPNVDGNTLAQIKDRFLQTKESPKEIAESFGLDAESVSRWLGSNYATKELAKFKIELLEDEISNLTISEISQICCINYKIIHKLLQDFDYKPARKRLEFSRVSDEEKFLGGKATSLMKHPWEKLGINAYKYAKLKENGRIAQNEFGEEYIIYSKPPRGAMEDPINFLSNRAVEINEHLNQLKIDARAMELTKNALDGELHSILLVLRNMGVRVTVDRRR